MLSEWSACRANSVHLLGIVFLTDDAKLYNYLNQSRFETGYKYDEEMFEKEFPGVREAAVSAIKDINSKKLVVGHLVYINGIMQAWCQLGFGDPATGLPHPPGKLCPNNKLYPVECR